MYPETHLLSILNISEICDVARSTVSYWIARKGLSAHRSGNKFMVAVDDLVVFLESTGRSVPEGLVGCDGGVFPHTFRPFVNCWEYWKKDSHGENCENCLVFKYHIAECFTVKNSRNECPTECPKCQYYYEHYARYTAFIHQMSMPAAVFKDMYIWTGNRAWAELCGVEADSLIGLGIEEIVHPESIRNIINFNKRIKQEENAEFIKSTIYFEDQQGKKISARLTITPLTKPEGACFAIAEGVSSPVNEKSNPNEVTINAGYKY